MYFSPSQPVKAYDINKLFSSTLTIVFDQYVYVYVELWSTIDGFQTLILQVTVKPVLSAHSKKDKTKILKTNGSLMKVESTAECSPWSILQYF